MPRPRIDMRPHPTAMAAWSGDAHGADGYAAAILAELKPAFEAFKENQAKRLEAVEAAVDEHAAAMAAQRIGGGPGEPLAGFRAPGSGAGRYGIIGDEVSAEFRAQMAGHPRASMSTQSNPDGGYTVAPQIDTVIGTVLRDLSPLRGLARVVPQPMGTGEWEKIVQRAGAQAVWAGEEDDRADTDGPTLGKISIFPHELYAVPSLTNHLIEDSTFDLNAFLAEDVAGEFALAEGAAFVAGNGVKKPRGFLTYPVTDEVDAARAWGTLQYVPSGDASGFAATDPGDALKNLVASLRPAYRKGAGVGWLMNSTTANEISKFKDGQGNYLWTNSVIIGQPDRLLGYPVTLDEGLPDVGADAFPVAFGNWPRGYAIVDKPGLRLITDRVTRKGWTKLYFSRRVGGGVTDFNALKLLKIATS